MSTATVTTVTSGGFEAFINSPTPTLVDFWAPWCAPCRALGPVIESIAADLDGKARIGKVNIDDEKELAAKYGIASIPTVLVFKDGQVTDTLIGIRPREEYQQALID